MLDDKRPAAAHSFVITLKLDDVSFQRLQTWRQSHFPPALNHIPAHLTLFHTVAAAQVSRLRQLWPGFQSLAPPSLTYAAPRYLGRGVAIDVNSQTLGALRVRLMEAMAGEFTRQDQQPFRGHVTIQNKSTPADARGLFDSLRNGFKPWAGRGEAVLIWRYRGGPWSLESEHGFNG